MQEWAEMKESKNIDKTLDWEEIIRREGARLLALGLRFCRHRQDAEDLVQETYLQAFQKWDQFEGQSKISTWLFTIASRICIRKKRLNAGEPKQIESLEELLPSSGETIPAVTSLDPLVEILRQELQAEVARALSELPDHFRLPTVLREIGGLTINEIAEILELSKGTVKSRIHRSRLILRKSLSAKIPIRRSNNISPPNEKQICLDLLEAKQTALDRGISFPVGDQELSARCYSVLVTLDLTEEVLAGFKNATIPEELVTSLLKKLGKADPS